jgi:prepilin peptidase CpaA
MPTLIYIYVTIQLLIVAYYDVQTKKIINLWPLANIFLYIVLVFWYPEYYKFSIGTFAWPIGIFIAGFMLFVLKIMGGGDSKYLATFYLLIPENMHDEAFISLAVATALVGGSVFIKNIMQNLNKIVLAWKQKDLVMIKNIFGKKFAYAPVILISWMWFGWKIKDKIKF